MTKEKNLWDNKPKESYQSPYHNNPMGKMSPMEKKLRTYFAIGFLVVCIPIIIQVATKSMLVHFIYWPILFAFGIAVAFVYFKKWSKEKLENGKKH